jgi:hypothetical protein
MRHAGGTSSPRAVRSAGTGGPGGLIAESPTTWVASWERVTCRGYVCSRTVRATVDTSAKNAFRSSGSSPNGSVTCRFVNRQHDPAPASEPLPAVPRGPVRGRADPGRGGAREALARRPAADGDRDPIGPARRAVSRSTICGRPSGHLACQRVCGSVIRRVFSHDVWHTAEVNEALGNAGLQQIDLWDRHAPPGTLGSAPPGYGRRGVGSKGGGRAAGRHGRWDGLQPLRAVLPDAGRARPPHAGSPSRRGHGRRHGRRDGGRSRVGPPAPRSARPRDLRSWGLAHRGRPITAPATPPARPSRRGPTDRRGRGSPSPPRRRPPRPPT